MYRHLHNVLGSITMALSQQNSEQLAPAEEKEKSRLVILLALSQQRGKIALTTEKETYYTDKLYDK